MPRGNYSVSSYIDVNKVVVDDRYGCNLVNQMIKKVMRDGKAQKATQIVYKAIERLGKELHKDLSGDEFKEKVSKLFVKHSRLPVLALRLSPSESVVQHYLCQQHFPKNVVLRLESLGSLSSPVNVLNTPWKKLTKNSQIFYKNVVQPCVKKRV